MALPIKSNEISEYLAAHKAKVTKVASDNWFTYQSTPWTMPIGSIDYISLDYNTSTDWTMVWNYCGKCATNTSELISVPGWDLCYSCFARDWTQQLFDNGRCSVIELDAIYYKTVKALKSLGI